jgi:hypothetical protein
MATEPASKTGTSKQGHNKGAGFGVTELTGGLSRQGADWFGAAVAVDSAESARRVVTGRQTMKGAKTCALVQEEAHRGHDDGGAGA